MATYLVAFLVSEFEAAASSTNGTQEFGVYTRPDAKNQSAYAFDFGLKVVDALGTYFGINYYSTNDRLRLDHVALPDFRAGAMENWGLIKYRYEFIFVPILLKSTHVDLSRIGGVELAVHHYFSEFYLCLRHYQRV